MIGRTLNRTCEYDKISLSWLRYIMWSKGDGLGRPVLLRWGLKQSSFPGWLKKRKSEKCVLQPVWEKANMHVWTANVGRMECGWPLGAKSCLWLTGSNPHSYSQKEINSANIQWAWKNPPHPRWELQPWLTSRF